jgi:hypothetical protein
VAGPSGAVRLERDALAEPGPLGRPLGRPRAVRLGVDGAGAMAGDWDGAVLLELRTRYWRRVEGMSRERGWSEWS